MAGIRLSGLASGIDTETMIKQLMQAERAPVDRLSQKKQTLTWQRDAYREMNRALLDFRTAASDMLLSKNYQSKTVTSSNPTALTVTASPAASAGSVTIDSIDQLASAASVTLVAASGKRVMRHSKKVDCSRRTRTEKSMCRSIPSMRQVKR